MRRSFAALLTSALLAISLVAAGSVATADAATTCGQTNGVFKYQDVIFEPGKVYETVTLHAKGCWNGTKAWGTSLSVTISNSHIILGSSSSGKDPWFENMGSGNTYFTSRPVYKGSGGTIFLYYPSLLLSTTGTWTPYDHGATACSDPNFNPWTGYTTSKYQQYAWGYVSPVILTASSGSTFTCKSPIHAFDPVLKSKALASYTSK